MNALGHNIARAPQSITAVRTFTNQVRASAQRPRVGRDVLLQIVLVASSSAGLVAVGHVRLAAICMWGLLGLMSLRLVLLHRPEELACLLIGTAPLINLLRGVVFYTGVPLVYLAAVAYFGFSVPAKMREAARRYPLAVALVVFAFVYYMISVVSTTNPRQNMRVFEMACAAVMVLLIGPPNKGLATALVGILVSSWAVGMGAYAHLGTDPSMRLGIVVVDELAIGNPFALGMPLALGFLGLTVDRGWWLGLAQRRTLRWALLFPTVILLALSASRAGWFAALIGLATTFLLGRRQKWRLLVVMAGVAVVLLGLLHTPLGEPFQRGFERTFGEERTLTQASSGRSDQWNTFWHALTDNPFNLLVGYGVGDERAVHANISAQVSQTILAGKSMDFHALLMQVGVEFGLLGLLPVLLWLVIAMRLCIRGSGLSGFAFPVSCLLGFVLGAMTVSGLDTVSGVLLGIGLLSTRRVLFVRPGQHHLRKRGRRDDQALIPFPDNNRHLFQTVGPRCCAAVIPGGAARIDREHAAPPYPLYRLSLGIGITRASS